MSILARLLGVLALLVTSVALVATAANTVPGTNLGRFTQAITANTLKPAACSGITLTNLVIGNTGTAANDLVLGSAAADVMDGGAGNDCILGGGGNDIIDGGSSGGGTDVCIGGPGIDVFNNCATAIQ
jgi:Ca2+-binding RTX toxin-like protein